MKYTSGKDGHQTSLTATEIKRLLDAQEPPLGNTALAQMIGVTAETINSVVYRGRTPGVGMLNGIARALKLDDEAAQKLFTLHERDVVRNKIRKVTGASGEGVADLASLLTVLNEGQIKMLERKAVLMALDNQKAVK